MRNYIPDEKELLLLKEMAAEGCTISKIAAYTNHDRGTIRRLLERNKITLSPSTKNKMGKKYIWSQKKIERLRDFYSTNEFSLEEIANFFETSVNTILKQAKLCGLDKPRPSASEKCKQAVSKANSKPLNKEEIKFIKDNVNTISVVNISKKLKRAVPTIMKYIKENNLRAVKKVKRIVMPEDENFLKDLKNPSLSHSYVGRKYGYSLDMIKKWRKEKFTDFSQMTNWYLNKSTTEIDFEEILKSNKLVFVYQEKIKKWRVDYNLGFNLLVEINGDYWHSLDRVKEKDARKIKELEDLGYTVLTIWEKDLKNPDKVKNIIIQQLECNFKKYIKLSLNLENSKEVSE